MNINIERNDPDDLSLIMSLFIAVIFGPVVALVIGAIAETVLTVMINHSVESILTIGMVMGLMIVLNHFFIVKVQR